MVNSCHSREIRVQRKLIRMVKISVHLCNLWENKNTIRMANSCHKHSQLCCVKENPDEGFDAPPTLERSGSERRVGAFNIPCPMRGKGLGESGGASLQGKGGRVGFRKKWFSKKWYSKKMIS